MTPYSTRTRRLPAPPHVVWDDLVSPAQTGSRVWLNLVADEIRPRVLECERPCSVVWSSLWRSRPDDRIVFGLAEVPVSQDTALTFTLLTPSDVPDEDDARLLRKRISRLIFAELRFSYGQ
ncbi:MAG: hypothetical protein QM655_00855 [Nocardioidaceae bacterium]